MKLLMPAWAITKSVLTITPAVYTLISYNIEALTWSYEHRNSGDSLNIAAHTITGTEWWYAARASACDPFSAFRLNKTYNNIAKCGSIKNTLLCLIRTIAINTPKPFKTQWILNNLNSILAVTYTVSDKFQQFNR